MNLLVAVKGTDIKVFSVNTFSYGPTEHTDEEVTAALTARLESEGYECSTVPVVAVGTLAQAEAV
jgi:hypothetical protein